MATEALTDQLRPLEFAALVAANASLPVDDGVRSRLTDQPSVSKFILSSPRPLMRAPSSPVPRRDAELRYQSPLRYPGAKGAFTSVISELIAAAVRAKAMPPVKLLVEPFAGGASTSLRLLGAGLVERAVLADADPLVASFWQIAASEPEELIARMREEHETFVSRGGQVALERWDYWRNWEAVPGMSANTSRFEMAIRCLFLNRTTFSGILHGRAGPIGGRAQTSAYKIGCRFNPDSLASRIQYVGNLYAAGRLADVWCSDWRETVDRTASVYKTVGPKSTLLYLDPPYMEKSSTLYNISFDSPKDSNPIWKGLLPHLRLAEYLMSASPFRWILSYDDHPQLLDSFLFYGRARMNPGPEARKMGAKALYVTKSSVRLHYSAASNGRRSGTDELLITTLPKAAVVANDRMRPLSAEVEKSLLVP